MAAEHLGKEQITLELKMLQNVVQLYLGITSMKVLCMLTKNTEGKVSFLFQVHLLTAFSED